VHSSGFDGAGIQELTGLIYDSVSDSSRWTEFMAAFARAAGAPRCALLIADSDEPHYSAVLWHGWPDEDVQLYLEKYGEMDPMRLVSYQVPEGTVAADYEICPRDRFESSVIFREFYAPRQFIHSMGGVILTTPTGQSVISAHRGDDAGPFGEKEKTILRSLMPHLKRAALLHGELGLLRRQLATFTGHLERFPYAFLLVDARRRVLYLSAAARELIAERDGLAIDQGNVVATSRKSQASFDKAVMELATGGSTSIRRLEIPRPSRRNPYRMILMPIDGSRTIPLSVAVPAVSILVIDAHSSARPDPAVLRELFSFTPAEARVSMGLVMGQSAEEIALETKTSVQTVRTHIKRILSKTSTARQGELISSILRTVPFQSPETPYTQFR
jgi:DNA-binding CsgD family transcriptional regulator